MSRLPKSFAELEQEHAKYHQTIQTWQAKARAWATEHGMNLPEEVTPETFFGWLAQEEQDANYEAFERDRREE